jgi:hypothetical protein
LQQRIDSVGFVCYYRTSTRRREQRPCWHG